MTPTANEIYRLFEEYRRKRTAAQAAAALAKFAALVTSDTPAGEAANRRLADEIMQAYDAAEAAIPLDSDTTDPNDPGPVDLSDDAARLRQAARPPLADLAYTVTADTAQAISEIEKLRATIAHAKQEAAEAAAAMPQAQPTRPPTHPIALEIASRLATNLAKDNAINSIVPSEPTARRAVILAAFAAMASAEAAAASASALARIATAVEGIAAGLAVSAPAAASAEQATHDELARQTLHMHY